MIRLFACDLDGTLLNAAHESDEIIRDAVERITAEGKYFAVATGRQMNAGRIAELGFDREHMYTVCLSGALIYGDRGEILYHRGIEAAFVRKIIRAFPDIEFRFHGVDCTYARYSRERFIEDFMSRPDPSADMGPGGQEKRMNMFMSDSRFDQSEEEIAGQEILKITCRLTEPDRRRKLDNFLYEHRKEAVNAPFDDESYEITHRSVDKGEGVAWLGARLGVSESETAVYGDSLNDLAMLKRFCHSYAMAGAVPEAKEAAREILGRYEDYAVPAHILKTLEQER